MSAVVMHDMVMDARVIRMSAIAKAKMIAADPAHFAMHCHAADVNASTEAAHMRTAVKPTEMSAAADAADVRASAKSSHVPATAETSAVTATSASAPRIGRTDSQHGGKRGRGQHHQYSFHQNTLLVLEAS
jgi:hypothetical protein